MILKVFILEDGMINGFLLGELIEFVRVKRMNCVLEEVIFYKLVLLGIIKVFFNI